MSEYIEREAIIKAYMDLCLAKSKLTKSRKGATFFQSDLLPETEPTTKELFRLVMAMPAADVAQAKHAKKERSAISKTGLMCTACFSDVDADACFCKYCGARMDEEDERGTD